MLTPEPLAPAEESIARAAQTFIETWLPDFAAYVNQARQEARPVILVVEGFIHPDTREQVQACLWYALGLGATITVRLERPTESPSS